MEDEDGCRFVASSDVYLIQQDIAIPNIFGEHGSPQRVDVLCGAHLVVEAMLGEASQHAIADVVPGLEPQLVGQLDRLVPAGANSPVRIGIAASLVATLDAMLLSGHFVSPSLLCLMSGRNDCYFTSLSVASMKSSS